MTQAEIDAICPGWSDVKQWRFFESLVKELPAASNVLMLGVFNGRDMAYILEHAKAKVKNVGVHGVDLFDDVPGDDWNVEDMGKTWMQAQGIEPPSISKTNKNLIECGASELNFRLLKHSHLEFFSTWLIGKFDAIYIDLSHDYQTTAEAIILSKRFLVPGGTLCGDDYSNEGTWGVKRAVDELCPHADIHDGWIWSKRIVK